MAAEDRHEEVFTDEECIDCTERERSFDALARGVANGSISRRKALRVFGASLLGSVLAAIPGAAIAAPPTGTCLKEGKPCKTNTDCCSQNCETKKGKLVCGPAVQCKTDGDCPQPTSQCLQVVCANGFCGAAQAKPNGTGCNDGNPCTVGDTCQGGVCTPGGPKDCSDNDICTTDTCNPVTGACEHMEIQGCCRTPNDCPTPTNQCQQATCTAGACGVENKPNGSTCDDQNSCTENDECTGGLCAGTRITGCVNCTVDRDCSMVEVTQCQEAFCDTTAGICATRSLTNGTDCSTSKCLVGETCLAGVCQGGSPKNCDDNNECTTDSCDPATGNCVHTKLTGTTCETGNKCTADTCDDGVCKQGPLAVTCPQCQVCDTDTGTCVNVANGTLCEDGDVCTLGDTCQGGTCQPGPVKVCGQCEECENVGGVATCVPDTSKNTQTCSTSKCLVGETCLAGVCQGGSPKNCDDNNECTTDSCDPATGNCVHTKLTGTTCETGNKCTADTCDDGVCKQGPLAVTCPQCQVCDTDTGTCVNLDNDTPCSDGDVCTLGDTCQGGTCQPGPVKVCGQCEKCENVGGVATCVPDTSKNTQTCSTSKCLVGETCLAGVCQGGSPKNCDDNNECTTDSCDPATGNCVHTKLTGTTCETGNKCTADTCDDGVCKQGPLAVTCPQCQICDTANGTCKANTAVNGTTCTSSNLCITGGATCLNGTCQGGTAKTCPTGQTCAPATGTCTCTTGVTCGSTCCTGTGQICCPNGTTCGLPSGAACNGNGNCCSNNCQTNPRTGNKTCA